jgi:hypothetical protein
LFEQNMDYVSAVYGRRAVELRLGRNPGEKILDVLERPDYYAEVVREVRSNLAARHSYTLRFQELLEIVRS